MEKTKGKLELIFKYFSDFTHEQIRQFSELDELYREWNSKINVVSRKDIECLYQNHILHSLSIAAAFQFEPGQEIIDIGTGGGFPGIPLAIYFPEVQFHLVDSIGKKIKVVKSIIESIGLKNCETQQIRAEEIKARKFDFAISRAVASLKNLCKWTKPLLKGKSDVRSPEIARCHSALICLKGGNLSEEIKDAGCEVRLQEIYELFQEDYFKQKFIVCIPKSSMKNV